MEYSKVQQGINDVVGDNVKKLAQLFPSAVKDGEVDFEALKEELGQFTEVDSEKYELTWAGKKNAKKIAQEDIIGKTLKFIPEDSKNADTTENLYIEGDNLEVLKLLRQNYYGAIKMIYIDPPYNTGNDFVYNDSFEMSKTESDVEEGVSDADVRYTVNSKSKNRFHARWLNMMLSRLTIAKDLLTNDGIVFISIDDTAPKNVGLIKVLMTLLDGDDFFVLDFFSGSATTAQAVMEQNMIDGGKRKYILVQWTEEIDEKQASYKAGFRTICQIGKERIRLAGDKLQRENPDANVDIGFKVFRVADTNIKWNSLVDAGQLDLSQIESSPDLVDFMPGADDVDIVYELMLRQRDVALSETLELLSNIGNRTYLYASSYLVCLETEITVELINKLAELDPLPIKFIFRDSAFKDDIALKDETFRRLKALIEKNAGTDKPTYTVEFI